MSESRAQFEHFMSAGVQANNAGWHHEALESRLDAYALAEDNIQAGRAARDIGRSFAALGDDGERFVDGNLSNGIIAVKNTVLAEAYADHAVWLHRRALESAEPGAEREYRASAGYAGVMALRRAMASENAGELHLGVVAEAKKYLAEAAAGPDDDQYTINFAGRYAIAISLYHDGAHGRSLAKEAWRLSKYSEAPGLPHSTPGLSSRERKKAQTIARIRAAGAFMIGLPGASLQAKPDGSPTRLRGMALTLAERLI